MNRLVAVFVAMVCAMGAWAQVTITGKVVEKESQEALVSTTVKLLRMDSTLVAGAVTGKDGSFSIESPGDGRFIVRVSCVGYKNYTKNITIKGGTNVAMGKISLEVDAIMLKGATVTANAAKVIVKEDTFIYNAAAYRTPEGSVIEELVKRLPGAKVDDEGNVTINGKEVKKVLVDGKEFMTGDTKTAMKNLPTSIVDKVKAYDEKSDLARISGIDDGEEQTVLDFGIKPGMNKGIFSNIDLAAGTEDRYAGRIMGAMFRDKFRLMLMGNANNTNDMGFPGGGGGGGRFGGNRSGLIATKMVGLNMNYEKTDVIKVDGSVRWNHSDGDSQTQSSSENFVTTSGSFSNSNSLNLSCSDQWNAQMRIEWTPDTMTNIIFRPTFSYSRSNSTSQSNSATYNDDPYLYTDDPLSDAGTAILSAEDSVMVNSNYNTGINFSTSTSVGGTLQINRKLNSKGRNVTLRGSVEYSDSEDKGFSTNNVHLYQITNAEGTDSTYQTNRYNTAPQKKWSYSARATYSEPIFNKSTFLQLSYEFKYNYTKSDRSTYDFSNLGEDFFSGLTPSYRGWGDYLARLDNPIEYYYDEDLSRFSEYKNYIHDIQLMLRLLRTKYNLSLGVTVMPQRTEFRQDYQGVSVDTTRTVTNVTPTADLRWKISKVSQLRFNYRGTTSQPNMTDLLSITDDSDPLNITMGNPGLKPSFTNTMRLFYNNYMQKMQRAVMVNMNFSTTRNDISDMVTYDETTGGRTTQPQNINGNWNIGGAFMFNTALDTLGRFYANTFTDASYTNRVGYLNLDNSATADKNTVKTTSLKETLTAGYRNDWLEFELTGNVTYEHTRNELQPDNNMDTWQFSYGFNADIQLPWGTTIATNMGMNSRRGYSDSSMNTNELVWNAQVSHGFLKGKPLTLSLQFYDLLGQQSTVSRTISAMQRSDTRQNAINQYAMLHVIYRMNLFGSKEAREEMKRERREGMMPPGGPGERPEGPPPGGEGGGPGGPPPGGGFGGPGGGFGGA